MPAPKSYARLQSIASKLKISSPTFILPAILIVGFILRLGALTSGGLYLAEDANKEYLVARHVVNYNEWVLTGPVNTVIGKLTSPLYFYYLAVLVKLRDSIWFPSLVNVVLQTLSIFLVFLLVSNVFDKKKALPISLLFALSEAELQLSSRAWPPYSVQPIVILSFLLLIVYQSKKRLTLLLLSIMVFAFASAFYNSIYLIAPFYLLLVFYLLYKNAAPANYFVYTLLSFLGSLFILYAPPLIFYLASNLPLGNTVLPLLTPPQKGAYLIPSFIHHFERGFATLLSILFQNSNQAIVLLILFLLPTSLSSFLTKSKNRYQKWFLIGTLAFALQPILWTSTILSTSNPETLARYYIPVYPALILFIGMLTLNFPSPKRLGHLLPMFLFIILLYLVSPRLPERISKITHTTSGRNVIVQVKHSLLDLQKEGDYDNLNFFLIETYKEGERYLHGEAPFWSGLEKELDQKFTVNSDSDVRSYAPNNKGDYILVVCLNEKGGRTCLKRFLTNRPSYVLTRSLYSDGRYDLYLAKNSLLSKNDADLHSDQGH